MQKPFPPSICCTSGSSEELQKRRQRQGEEDLRRSAEHQKRLEASSLRSETLRRFKEQVDEVAKASAEVGDGVEYGLRIVDFYRYFDEVWIFEVLGCLDVGG